MAVIINDFEVIVEPPPREEVPGMQAREAPPPPAASLTPQDLRDVFAQQAERLARVRAH